MGKKRIKTFGENLLEKEKKVEKAAEKPKREEEKDTKTKKTKEKIIKEKGTASTFKKKQRSKKYQKALTHFDPQEKYSPDKAFSLLEKIATSHFDETVEVLLNLNIDPQKTEQKIRTIINLPYGTGKKFKILVFGENGELKNVKKSNIAYLGDEKIIAKIEKGWVDFDKVIATPKTMPKITKLAKILGPKGLMPNPKTETVTTDLKKTIDKLQSGALEIKTQTGSTLIHAIIGKISFGKEKLKENFLTLIKEVKNAKPPKAKEPFLKKIIIKSTMSPRIKINITDLTN